MEEVIVVLHSLDEVLMWAARGRHTGSDILVKCCCLGVLLSHFCFAHMLKHKPVHLPE